MEIFLKDEDFIVSKTDQKGVITYCNDIFVTMSGYKREELLDKPHNIIRHEDMPKIAFKIAWDKIKNHQDFFGFVKNKTKENKFYWVFAYISPDYDSSGRLIGYTSIRRKPLKSAVDIIEPIYKELLSIEKKSITDSENALLKKLKDLGLEYNEFVVKLQKGEIK